MQNPLVSIIIPVYGVEKFITKCFKSLLRQSYTNIELIFIDDCTKDNSIKILKNEIKQSGVNNVQIVSHKTNRGLSAARNTGVKLAKGQYILHVDSDDWVEPNMVGNMVDKALNSNADIVICGSNTVYSNYTKVSLPHIYERKDDYVKDMLYKKTVASMWGKLISKSIYDNHPDAWSIEGINHGEDYATMPRIINYSNKIAYLMEPLYNYNMLNNNSYTKNFSENSLNSMLKADEVLYNFFYEKYGEAVMAKMFLRSKSGMIKRCNPKLYPLLSKTYNNIPSKYLKQLSIYDRSIIFWVGKGFNRLLAKLINWSIIVRQH